MKEIKFRVLANNKLLGYERLVNNQWEWNYIELNPDKGERWCKGVFTDSVLAFLIKSYGTPLVRNQYTGLKDKNGKEIYEGDVIELFWLFTGMSYFTTVIWVCDLAKWAMAEKNGKGVYHYFGDQNTKLMDTEVIGNIYENPEFL